MSVVCFAATHSLSLASDPIRGRLIGTETVDALLAEDNSDAFIAWRHEKVEHRTIVHIDSHIDLGWVSDSDLRRIFDSKTAEQLKQLQLSPLHPEESALKPLRIMSYIYPAIMEGMVSELYWVPPDSLLSGESVLDTVKDHLIETLGKLSIDDLRSFGLEKGVIKGRAYGIPLTICKLSDLPRFEEAVVLDIDVDYFDPPDLEKKIEVPAIWPGEFVETLKKKAMRTDVVSLCYSVRGGYLALEYRFLGDELKEILRDPEGNDQKAARVRRHRKLGLVYRSKGMYREAIEEFQKALELSPDDASLHYGLGLIYSHLGNSNEATRELARATAIDPMYGDPVISDADYYLNKKMYGRALPLYEEVLRRKPTYVKGLFGAGLCCSQQGKLESAEKYYQKCIEIQPNFSLAHFNLGVIYSEMKMWKRAEEEYRQALELNPHNGKAHQNLGRLYDMQGDIHRAISAYEKAVENNPCFKAAHNNLGGLYARGGRYDEAINEFRKAVRIDPHYVMGYSNLGKMHLIQGNASGALEAFQHALSIDPKNLWARYYLGRLYIMMSRYGEGIVAYEEVIDDHPNFFPAYIDLARILGEKGIDVDRALKLAQKAVELRPTAQTFDLLAWLYFRRGMYEDAEKAIERAVGLDPSNESIIRHREEIRREMGYR
jgi:tetratricopeptide (TPR) repeat protein